MDWVFLGLAVILPCLPYVLHWLTPSPSPSGRSSLWRCRWSADPRVEGKHDRLLLASHRDRDLA
jgi:hypothetical protein